MSAIADFIGNLAGDYEYYFAGGKEAEATGKALDQQIAAVQKQELNSGNWTQAQYDQAQANLTAGQTGDVQALLDAAGRQGANESAAGKAIDSTTGFSFSLVGNFLKAIPWWVYLAAAGAAFFYFGGGAILRAKLVKKLS